MSKIEVNKIGPQCGTTLTVGCGAGQTVVADAATVTLGRCGGTVALASGATQTGFGRTGTVDWQTAIKTVTFTAVNGEGYFVDTATSGAVTVNLPAGSAGAIVAIADYARNFATANCTVSPNGSEKIGGIAANTTLSDQGQAITLVYIDSTQGWINVQNATTTETGLSPYVTATGGTISNSGNFRIHTFTGPGTFCVTSAGAAAPGSGTGSNLIDYIVVAGGGGSGGNYKHIQGGGGGGAGGFRASPGGASGCYTASPLGAAPAVSLPAPIAAYPITIGAGGTGGTKNGCTAAVSGNNSVATLSTTITAAGGGGGGSPSSGPNSSTGFNGGSGGGGAGAGGSAGSGNTPPTNPGQGSNGGGGAPSGATLGGAGGGATGAGGTSPNCGTTPTATTGGTGATSCISASPVVYSTGGNYTPYNPSSWSAGANATANTGNGGNSQNAAPSPLTPDPAGYDGLNGGSGVVIIRYKYQN
jgi:hypothetical protein